MKEGDAQIAFKAMFWMLFLRLGQAELPLRYPGHIIPHTSYIG